MRKQSLLIAAASALLLTSCSSKLGELTADNFNVVPNPLEAEVGQVPATINGTFPEKYMKKKAVVTVTPELRYADGKVARGTSATFQGEKVKGNDQTISYKVGGNYTMKSNFAYVPDMLKSELYLTFDAKVGKKSVEVPAVKVANGVIATSMLYTETAENAQACIAPDAFQRITAQKQEANVKFLIQQANLRRSELKNNSVKEFVELLKRINDDKKNLNLNNIEISAYASPDGGFELNEKLASNRQKNTEKYLQKELKKIKMESPVDAKYTAQDWEGFQELVKASNIQDKDVILRVLSMYKDPEEREQQIKNMSAGFKELAEGVLPELRRARLTINYEVVGRSNEEIKEQYNADAKVLTVEELLYAATLTDNATEKEGIYKTTTQVYPNDARAYNNLATLEFAKGNYSAAKNYAQKALSVNAKCQEANANLGLIALQAGDVKAAEALIAKAPEANGISEILGNLNLAKGNYSQAISNFANTNSNSAALAQIMSKNYSAAAQVLNNVKNANAMTEYLKAVLNARQGNNSAAATALKNAIAKDPSLAKYAANDLELSNVSK
ncbi:MAG: tetratricopeptide repeat protein [Prevotella sp.]|nr:tetratricopeptide repeat protein [Prevotella sp.]MBR6593028.1 tetratricopeptide repeat protein [Prevotella sp.]